nr:RNA-directed DNA polymerase, eukaryota [Tanacetum cinerariifolium]
MDRKGIDVDSLLCPVCREHVESVNHIFFSCWMARDLWVLLARWCDLDIPELHNIVEWLSWVDDCQVSKKARLILEGIVATMICILIPECIKLAGILPVSKFPSRFNVASTAILPMEAGMGPDILFKERSRSERRYMEEMVSGICPGRFVMHGGIIPEIPFQSAITIFARRSRLHNDGEREPVM